MRLPTHSTIAAYGALFIALGGTSYAATQIPTNSNSGVDTGFYFNAN